MHRILAPFFAVLMAMTAPATHVGDIAVCAVTERVTGDRFVFTGHCPRFSGIGDSDAQKKLNAQMRERLQGAQARAKAAAAVLPTDDRSEQHKVEGIFGYEVKRNSGGIVSLLFSDILYAGGASATEAKTGLSFFTGTGDIFALPSLFLNSENGMRQVNDEVKRQLHDRGLETALVKANPIVDSQQSFYLTDTTLVLVVPEQTWFSQPMGTVEFSIPLTQFAGGLRDEFAP